MLDSCTPSDFVRKLRSICDVKHWKSTELQTFLLYTGPIVLKESFYQMKFILFFYCYMYLAISYLNKSRIRKI